MCLILFAWQTHPGYPLVVAANRDEYFDRPTAVAARWHDAEIVAGRDLHAGGSWLGIGQRGRFAALTNYRNPGQHRDDARSRGELVSRFLAGTAAPRDYANAVARDVGHYNGFNLLVGDQDSLWYVASKLASARAVPPGIWGLSNHLLDSPWRKVVRGKLALQAALPELPATDRLFSLLGDTTQAEPHELPDTGIGPDWERLLSAAFIRSPGYGTRSSSVVLADLLGHQSLEEVSFDPDGRETGRVCLSMP